MSDDPVAAALVLVERRHACFAARKPSASCLDTVEQRGSDLRLKDEAALGRPGSASERDYATAKVTPVQRWARAALVTVVPGGSAVQREPASLLLVRGEAGWRLREVFP